MARFVKLRMTSGQDIWINPETVQAVSEGKFYEKNVTIVAFPGDSNEFVRIDGAVELVVQALEAV